MARGRSNRTRKKREVILAAFGAGLSVDAACEAAQIPRSSYYDWRHDDAGFAADADAAVESGTDQLEDIAYRRASESSDTLLIFLLKARRPHLYRDTQRHEHTGADGSPLTITFSPRADGPE